MNCSPFGRISHVIKRLANKPNMNFTMWTFYKLSQGLANKISFPSFLFFCHYLSDKIWLLLFFLFSPSYFSFGCLSVDFILYIFKLYSTVDTQRRNFQWIFFTFILFFSILFIVVFFLNIFSIISDLVWKSCGRRRDNKNKTLACNRIENYIE